MDDMANTEDIFSTRLLDEEFDDEIDLLDQLGLSLDMSESAKNANF